MTDIVHRLRNDVCLTSTLDWQEHVALAREAADEIERLQGALERLGSNEAFTNSFYLKMKTNEGRELDARLDYARAALAHKED